MQVLRKAPQLFHLPAERISVEEISQFYTERAEQTDPSRHELLEGWHKRELSLALVGNNKEEYTDELTEEALTLADASYGHFARAIDQFSCQKKGSARYLIEAHLATAERPLIDARLLGSLPTPEELALVHASKIELGTVAIAKFNQLQDPDTEMAIAQSLGHLLLSRVKDFNYTPYTASIREQMGSAQAYFPPRESGLSIRARFRFKNTKAYRPDQTVLRLTIANALSTNVLPAAVHGRASKDEFWSKPEGIRYGFRDLLTESHSGEVSEVIDRTTRHFKQIIDHYDGKHTEMHNKSEFYWPSTKQSDEDWAREYRASEE